jgi:hypothetical protein
MTMRTLFAVCILAACASLAAQPSYNVTSDAIPGGYTPVTGGTLVPIARNQHSGVISPPGFSFHFFNEVYTEVQIASAGYIILGGFMTSVTSTPTPTIDGGRVIAPAWMDLDPSASLIGLAMPTNPPPGEISWAFSNDIMEIEWKNVPRFNGTTSNTVGVNLKIVLDTATRNIEFHYGPVPAGASGALQRTGDTCCIAGVAGLATQEVIVGQDGTNIQSGGGIWSYPTNRYVRFEPTFPPPNLPPEIAVHYDDPAQPQPVQILHNGSINVPYNAGVSSLNFVIDVTDPDNDDCTVSAMITNLGNTGIVLTQWEALRSPTPIQIMPTSGVFNALTGASHTVTLTANDGTVDTVLSFTINQEPAPPELLVEAGGATVTTGQAAAGSNRDFGDQDIADGPTSALLVEISNLGGVDLVLGNLSVSGDSADFVIDSAAFNNTVPVAGSTSFSVAFDPVSAGAKALTISFTHNDPGIAGPFEIELAGLGSEKLPVLVVREAGSAGPIVPHGGTVNIGSLDLRHNPTLTRTFHARNDGNADLTLGALTSSEAEFKAASPSIPGVLLPLEGVTFTVTFEPDDEGNYSATVSLEHDDPARSTPFQFTVTGTATRSTTTSGGGSGNGSSGCAATGGGAAWLLAALASLAMRRRRSVSGNRR